MPDSEHILFPCRVLPGTRLGTSLRVHLATAGVACLLTLLLMPVTRATLGIVPVLALALWVGFRFRPGTRSRLIDFERRRLVHWGWLAPPENVGPLGPRWLAVAVLVTSAAPLLGAIVAGALLAFHVREFRRVSGVSIGELRLRTGDALFAFAAHPDSSFGAVAGTGAMWIPRESIVYRRFHLIGLLLPYYLAAGTPVALLASSPSWAGLAAALALPLPVLSLAVLTICPLHDLQSNGEGILPAAATEWEQAVNRISMSAYSANGWALSDHLFLGWLLPSFEQAWHPFRKVYDKELPCRTPALLPLSSLDGHMHQCGPAQSGKTTNGQAGIITQLIRGRRKPLLDEHGRIRVDSQGRPEISTSDSSPIVAIDLKGDLALYNTAREECARRGQTFRFFTLEQGKATSHFNPIANLQAAPRPIIELCEMVLNMLDLSHGFFYGGGYYSEQSRNLLLKTLKGAKVAPTSWEQLYELLTDTLDRREHKDVFELLGRIYALAQYPVLGPAPQGTDTIHMPTVIERNECIYMWLPALESAMSVISIAKMAFFCFMDAARKWNNSGCERKHSYIVMDEAQVVCGQNMERVFQQVSGARVRLILSNQSLANLDSRDAPNLGRTIWANTRVKQTFGLLDSRERRDWIDLSGEEVGCIRSRTEGRNGSESTSSTTWQEVVHTRLNQNVISEVNKTAGQALVYVNGDSGLTPLGYVPRQVMCPYPMTYDDYLRRSRTPWPTNPEPRIRDDQVEETVVNEQAPEDIERRAESKYAALERLFRKIARQPHHGGPGVAD